MQRDFNQQGTGSAGGFVGASTAVLCALMFALMLNIASVTDSRPLAATDGSPVSTVGIALSHKTAATPSAQTAVKAKDCGRDPTPGQGKSCEQLVLAAKPSVRSAGAKKKPFLSFRRVALGDRRNIAFGARGPPDQRTRRQNAKSAFKAIFKVTSSLLS